MSGIGLKRPLLEGDASPMNGSAGPINTEITDRPDETKPTTRAMHDCPWGAKFSGVFRKEEWTQQIK